MRGLKYIQVSPHLNTAEVALLVSAWIEIARVFDDNQVCTVALLVSAWIEILRTPKRFVLPVRRTPRECVD